MRRVLKGLVELFRPRRQHPDMEVRTQAVEKLGQQAHLEQILERIFDSADEPKVRDAARDRLAEIAEDPG